MAAGTVWVQSALNVFLHAIFLVCVFPKYLKFVTYSKDLLSTTFQAFAAAWLRPSPFSDIRRLNLVLGYRVFGTACPSRLQESDFFMLWFLLIVFMRYEFIYFLSVFASTRTDMTRPIVAVSNFANAPKDQEMTQRSRFCDRDSKRVLSLCKPQSPLLELSCSFAISVYPSCYTARYFPVHYFVSEFRR
jgi:hypothetical protein